MKDKNILKSIKKALVKATPTHLPFLKEEIVQPRRPRLWQVISFATLAASAVVIALVSSNLTPSEVNNSSSNDTSINVRRPVSEMMAQIIDNSYTLTYEFDDLVLYTYEVAEPLIKISFTNASSFVPTSYYLDLTDADSPNLYQQSNDETWYVSTAQSYDLLGLISPLSFIDPSAVEDEWFIWNDAMDGYDLNPTYLPNLFENSPLQGVEDVEVWMTLDGEIVLSFGGRMHEDSEQHASLQLVYGNFGETRVTLPSNVQDFRSVAINELLNGSTNHRYQYYFTPISSDPNALPFTYQLGERDGDTFKESLYVYDNNGSSQLRDTYFTVSNNQYIKIVSDGISYQEFSLDEPSYLKALEDFYPVNLLDIQESWLDLDNETFLESFGISGYPILPDYLDLIFNVEFEGNLENLSAYVSLAQSYWQGQSVTLSAMFTLDGLPYQLFFQLSSINQVQGIFAPYQTGIRTTLEESLALAVGTASYAVEQFIIDAAGNYIPSTDSYVLVRSGQDYQRYRYNAQGYLDMDYFGQLGESYFSYTYVYNQDDYVRQTIDQATYEANVIDPQWIKLDAIQTDDYQENPDIPGEYVLLESAFERVFSDSFLGDYTLSEVVIRYSNLYEGFPMIVFSMTGEDRNTNQPVQFEARYSYLGQTEVYFPNPSDEDGNQNDGNDVGMSIETFNERYSEGIVDYIGTLYGFSDEGELFVYEVFSLQDNEVLTINRSDGTYTQLIRDGNQFTQTQGTLTSTETVVTSIDAATYDAARDQISFINFSAFNASNLISLGSTDDLGIYQVNLDSFDTLFNLPLSDTFAVTDAYVEITESYLSVSVYGFDQETGQGITLYLVLEAINLNVDLLSYLQ